MPFHGLATMYPQSQPGPALGQEAQEYVYNAITGTMASTTGLGISSSPAHAPLHQTTSSHESYQLAPQVTSHKRAYHDTSLPPTPQTAGLPSEPRFSVEQPVAIAPRPSSVQQSQQPKRIRPKGQDEERPSPKRRRSTNASQSTTRAQSPATLSASYAEKVKQDQFFATRLKQRVPWKEIVKDYEKEFGLLKTEAALQMQRKRLRETLRVWTDIDTKALESAHEYWQNNKFDIIAQKMVDYGVDEKWSPSQCQKKWEEMSPNTPAPQQPIPLRRAPTTSLSERWMTDQKSTEGFTPVPHPNYQTDSPSSYSASSVARSPFPFPYHQGYPQ